MLISLYIALSLSILKYVKYQDFFETITETFFETKSFETNTDTFLIPNFRDQYRDFFFRPNIFETDTESFFRDQIVSRPRLRLFLRLRLRLWLNTLYLWIQSLYLWFKTIFLSNGWLKTLLWPLWRRLKNCRHCSSWLMYIYTIKHFYSLMHCFKLYCIYFKSAMCFVTIPLVDAATLFFTTAKETKELFSFSIIF